MEYLDFPPKPRPPGTTTDRFAVVARRTGEPLGEIRYWPAWRQFVFEPACFPLNSTIWSAGCLDQISAFLKRLNDAFRAAHRLAKEGRA